MFKVPIAKLNLKNWLTWSRCIRSILLQFNKLTHITNDPPAADAANLQQWRTDDIEIQNLILTSVTEELSVFLLEENQTAKQLYDSLEHRFNPNNDKRRTQEW